MASGDVPRSASIAEAVEGVWREIGAALEDERHKVSDEIGSYPAPITACDEQFNYLLEKRDRIFRELARVRQAAGEPASLATCSRFIVQLAESSDLIGCEAAQRLGSLLRDGS